jgi:hypothetical protein
MNFIVNFLFLNFNTHIELPHFSKKIVGCPVPLEK